MIKLVQSTNTTVNAIFSPSALMTRVIDVFIFVGLIFAFFFVQNIYFLIRENRKSQDKQLKEQKKKFKTRAVVFVCLVLFVYVFYRVITFTTG